MIHRHRNPIWTCLAEDRLAVMLITDGEHLPPDAVVAMVRAKGVDGVVVTSDAAPGEFILSFLSFHQYYCSI